MTRTPGQAARHGAREAALRHARQLHFIGQFLVGVVLATLVVIGAAAVRLSQGPLPAAWLARQAAVALSGDGRNVRVGGADITWEGFQAGIDRPIDVVLRDVHLDDPASGLVLTVPRAAVSLSLFDAVQGRFVPRAVALDGVSAVWQHDTADAAIVSNTDWRAQAAALMQELRKPTEPSGIRSATIWGRLLRLRISNTAITVHEPVTGVVADLSGLQFDLTRAPTGGVGLSADGTIAIGQARIKLHAAVNLPVKSDDVLLNFALEPFTPAQLAGSADLLAPLVAAQLPVAINGQVHLNSNLSLHDAGLDVQAQAGSLLLADGAMPVRSAEFHTALTPDHLTLMLRQLVLQPNPANPPSHVSATLSAHLAPFAGQPGLAADLTLDADQVAVDDLPAIWPLGVGGPGTRPWLVANLHGGSAHNAHFALSLAAPLDFSDAVVSRLEGGLDGTDCGATWLPTVPPLEHASGKLVFTGPDTMEIQVNSAHQAGTDLVSNQALLKFWGLAGHDQFMSIDADLAGKLADVVGLLKHPRIHLLQKSHLTVRDPSGQLTGHLKIALPLKTDLLFDDVDIHANGKLIDAHIGGLAGGRDVDHAGIDFSVDKKGLQLAGTAEVAGVPGNVTGKMDFRDGPASQITEQVNASATVPVERMTALGLNSGGALTGAAQMQLSYQERRSGDGDVRVQGDLGGLGIADPRLAWSKLPQAAGQVEIHALLHGGAISALDRISADAPGLMLRGTATFSPTLGSTLHLDTLHLGETTDLVATLHRAPGDDAATDITLHGTAIDLSRLLVHRATDRKARGPAYRVIATLSRATMANGRVWQNVEADVASDGLITTHASVDAIAGSGRTSIRITPSVGGRELDAKSDDAGAMLGALDLSQRMDSGQLVATGHYNDTDANHPLDGSAEIDEFRVRDAPAVVRLLQGMSLYGLIEIARGPGLGFTKAIAPFRLTDDALTLRNVRAYSASLGFTAKGGIDLNTHVADIEGTVVPLYFFNSMLGKLPLLGRLFSPETDGGLLAVAYSIRGNLDDPKVGVNPLSALTPGMLRDFFDIFGN
ncbi:MAG: DUF3971 domain-containing protein [Acetobacteraceae bacterium]|nr:DUF3971 domain-containing protein [Acetobacteraceae bacterium]